MLSMVILIVLFTPEILGAVVTDKSLDVQREGKGSDDTEESKEYRGGNVIITGGGGGKFFNPSSTSGFRMLPQKYFTVEMRPDPDDVEIEFTVNELDIMANVGGDCYNDALEFTGANRPVELLDGEEMPVLCGTIRDQTFNIPINKSALPYEILLTILPDCESTARARTKPPTWDVKIAYLKVKSDAPAASGASGVRLRGVPHQCLQYHTATEGRIKSFNDGGMMLNNQRYSICFDYEVGRYCGVAFNFKWLDLGNYVDEPIDALMLIAYAPRSTRGCTYPSNSIRRKPPKTNGVCEHDYLTIGGEKHCGDYTDYIVTANGPSRIIVGVRSGMSNRMGEMGFSATYRMLGC